MKSIKNILVTGLIMVTAVTSSLACTNFLVTRGASKDGSTFISYAADSHALYGELYFWPAANYDAGAMLKVYEWDTGKYLGDIEQVAHTYNVTGNMNQHQLAIGETTYGGRHELVDTNGIIDYGNLIYITLQRAKNAREAIVIMSGLVEKYGYFSSGESFSISDPNEVWIMELIGKGAKLATSGKLKGQNENKGAVWVARQIPDGYVCGHANQARITTFPFNDDATSISSDQLDKIYDKNITTVYASDVMTFAKAKGYLAKDITKKNFSFSDTYAPITFGGARFCEIRVWSWFNGVASGMDKYWDYAKGKIEHNKVTGYANNRMPLWVKPTNKIDVHTVMNSMRNHLEGTELDMSKDFGAGAFDLPYRWRPLTWEVDGKTYCNERATATQQTGFSFVSQSRSWLPDEIGGILWFGVDDAASTVYTPIYPCIMRVPESFKVGNGSMMKFSSTAAFWVFNQVTNLAYTRYNLIHPEIANKQKELEIKNIENTVKIDAEAQKLYKKDKLDAVEYLTNYSVNTANSLVNEWKDFYGYLFVKYMDGNVKTDVSLPKNYKYVAPKVEQPGYGEAWKKKVVEETKDKLLMPNVGGH